LSLGLANGNRFSVALRFIPKEISDDQIAFQVNRIIKDGFINYFGMQRFGSYSIHTHEIGRACLRQNWIEVCKMLLEQHPEIDDEQRQRKEMICHSVFVEGDIEGALDLLDRRDRLEKSILMVLKRQPNGYYNAFQNIARNSRFIYIHSY